MNTTRVFTVTIHTDNDAFRENLTGEILLIITSQVLPRLRYPGDLPGISAPLKDQNGLIVGRLEYDEIEVEGE